VIGAPNYFEHFIGKKTNFHKTKTRYLITGGPVSRLEKQNKIRCTILSIY
jgi:hypothetical protein